ncbi:MAG: heme exporter protein CcmD [Alphaproteobacteria bacterium]|nr:heme exporter protein CcmD [Alphaproteobacteria bacterium]MBO6627112.1 heme exporter protein CcmD [Alphaproteobacteria bacterium]MDF1626396.1 heme exporter protein CcmD [Parvibaculaceae bacterium]|tara:strand:- start:57 stop:224 length:168 start_codon:yes stop_codon:yes gene_type:complete
MAEFFDMGGYGPYIWSSFGIALVAMAGIAMQSWYDLRTQKRLLAELEKTGKGRES